MMQILRSFRDDDSADVRLAALFHDCGKALTFSIKERIRFDHHASVSADLVSKALERLQCPRKRIEKIDWLVRHHMSMTFLEMPEERKAHWYFHPWFPELLRVMYLDAAGTKPMNDSLYKKIVQDYQQYLDAHPAPPKPLLSGEDVMKLLELPPGEEIGRILKELHDVQVEGKITTKKEAKGWVEKFRK